MEVHKAHRQWLQVIIPTFCLALLSACGTRVEAVAETVELAIKGEPDVTLSAEQIAASSHPIIYLTLGDNRRISLGLGFDDKGLYKWLSGEHEVLVTRAGRIIGLQGTSNDIEWVSELSSDPLRCITRTPTADIEKCALSWQTHVQVGNGSNAQILPIRSRFSFQQMQELTLTTGKTLNTELWYEQMTQTDTNQQWQNRYWVEPSSGRVVKSEQRWAQDLPLARVEEVKAYRPDLTLRGQD